MSSNTTSSIFKDGTKFSQVQINDIRSKVVNVQGILTTSDLEQIVPLKEIGRLPRRDAIVWFSMYSLAIANKYNEYDARGHLQIASFNALVAYLNGNCNAVDENFIFASEIYYLIRNKLYLFKLNGIYRKIFNQKIFYHNRTIKWTKKIPFSETEITLISFLQQPSSIIREIAYWSFKTNYNIALKYVYLIDRMSRRINEVMKKYENKFQPFSFFGLRKVTRLEYQFYEEIHPILTDFADFYRELCPLDDRILPRSREDSENVPNYIKFIGFNKSHLRAYLIENEQIYDNGVMVEQTQFLDSPPIRVKHFFKLKEFINKGKLTIDPEYKHEKDNYFRHSVINGFRMKECIFEIEELYKNDAVYLFNGGRNVLVLNDLLEKFVNDFFRLYVKLLRSEHKISLFNRLFDETLEKMLIKKEIRTLNGLQNITRPIFFTTKLRDLIKTTYSDIKYIQKYPLIKLEKLAKQMTEFSLKQLAESKIKGNDIISDQDFLRKTFNEIYSY